MSAPSADQTALQVKPAEPHPSSLTRAKTAVQFLLDPKTAPQPAHLRTRAVLRSLRYLTIFLFWRLVRYAKYAAVGALVAAVSGTAIGTVASGAAFVVAPPGILAGAGVGLMWAVARFGWNRARRRMRRAEEQEHADPRRDEMEDARQREREEKVEKMGLRNAAAEPW